MSKRRQRYSFLQLTVKGRGERVTSLFLQQSRTLCLSETIQGFLNLCLKLPPVSSCPGPSFSDPMSFWFQIIFFRAQLSSLALYNFFKVTSSKSHVTSQVPHRGDGPIMLLEATISSTSFFTYHFQLFLAFFTRFSTLFAYPSPCLPVYQELDPFQTLPWTAYLNPPQDLCCLLKGQQCFNRWSGSPPG